MNKEFIGFLAAFLTVVSLFPQVIKVYKTKRTTDLSLGRYSMICAALYSYILYMKLTEPKRKSQKN